MLIAREIADRDGSWIVAGDFNDVAWSHTTRLFKRLGGLRDPRVGRSFMGTFHADYPLLRFPIDHVFLSDGFRMAELRRHQIHGSDHFAMWARMVLVNPSAGVSPDPEGNDRADAAEIVEEGQEDAAKRGISDEDGTD